jgi:phosphoglycerate dehydrogenase-like enzyme
MALRVVFHGDQLAPFTTGFADLLAARLDDPRVPHADVVVLPTQLTSDVDRRAYAAADVIVSFNFTRTLPRPDALTLFHIPGAGFDAVDLDAVPPAAIVCNCFGHEQPIAEYVMAALLMREVPLLDADRQLRERNWFYTVGRGQVHGELAEKTIGLLGFGHIGKAVAARAKAFEMTVHVANRSAVPTSTIVDRAFRLDDLPAFWASADFFVISVPLAPETTGIVDAAAFEAMRPTAVVINVGRGPLIDEQALFDALTTRRIAGAVIDTWYSYPTVDAPHVYPSRLPFHELPNVLMTPHMSGWTSGTIRRRQRAIADNIARRLRGDTCVNVVRPALA